MQASRGQVLVLTVALGLFLSGSAFAKGGKGQGNGKGNSAAAAHGKGNGKGHDTDVTISLGGHRSGDKSRPAGWDKGKKTGWRDCDAPPGQAKKSGCGDSIRIHTHTRSHGAGKGGNHGKTGAAHKLPAPTNKGKKTTGTKPSPRGPVNRPARSSGETGNARPARN